MIGGYLYSKLDLSVELALERELSKPISRIEVSNHGYLFFDARLMTVKILALAKMT